MAREMAVQVAPAVVEREVAVRGYVPVFVDDTATEVEGTLFEEARRGYDGTRQYWLHGVFVGLLSASGRSEEPLLGELQQEHHRKPERQQRVPGCPHVPEPELAASQSRRVCDGAFRGGHDE